MGADDTETMTYPQNKRKSLKRKQPWTSPDDLKERGSQNIPLNGFLNDSERVLANGIGKDSEPAPRPFWTTYCEIYEKLAESASEIQTTEDCIVTTRIVDITSAKLAQEVQKLDLSSVDHWNNISSSLVRNWNKFFSVQENDGWSFSDLIPVNCCKSNYFGNRHLLKGKNSETDRPLSQKKTRIIRRDDNSRTKVAKPLEGMLNDKPLPLIEHMERVVAAIETNCRNGCQGVEYLRLVIDPNSFSSTVYNIFTISFLIREGRVAFHIGEQDELLVKLCPPINAVQNKENEKVKSHFIMDLTTAEWQCLVKRLKIKSAMVSCPNDSMEEDVFYERFSQSQKTAGRKRKT